MRRILGFMTSIILFGVVGLFLVPSVGAEGGYSFWGTWGEYGSSNGRFDEPYGLAIDDSDNVYVADTGNDRIQKFDPSGDLLTKWGASGSGDGQFYWPSMIGIDSSGNVYVSDWDNYRIQKFGPNGTFITAWGTDGTGDGQFDGPDGMAIDASGNVYVSDYYNHRIQKFDSNGNFLTKWGTEGSGNGQFAYPEGVAVDASGNVYVADSENNRIQKFNSNGAFIAKWGTSGFGSGQFAYPVGVAIDNVGNVYVSEWDNNRIQKFGPNGTFIITWGTSGSGNGEFNVPAGIAVNSSRDVHVADYGNNRIQVFSPDRFSDTPIDYWATPYIEVIYQAGYTTGYTDGRFGPDDTVTREQMAIFITRAMDQVPPDADCGGTAPFVDVPADRWSCKYVKRLVQLGITSGIGQGLFDPEGTVTREQMAAFITRALDEVPADAYCGTEDPFTDVPYSLWSCKYVKRLVELGITKGIGEGLYGPGNPVTRAQMAVFLARAFLGM
jgi:sugar lactone lactonase YvrE